MGILELVRNNNAKYNNNNKSNQFENFHDISLSLYFFIGSQKRFQLVSHIKGSKEV